jgi:hypothetical protein
MIQKHLHNKKPAKKNKPRLDSYLKQAQSFRHTKRIREGGSFLQKVALAAIIPLAATSSVVAQPRAACITILTTTSYDYVIKYLMFNYSCINIDNNNASCYPSTTNTSVASLTATATQNAVLATCTWSCSCGLVIIDCEDGLGAPCDIVPVELSSFIATPDLNSIVLKWETASEINNSGYEILRSIDGRYYHKVFWTDGHGNSQEGQSYSWVDRNIRPNTNYYYRLNQIDRDGTNTYSEVVSAMITDEKIIEVSEVFPNPVKKDFVKLKINTPVEVEAKLIIFDGMGMLVKKGEKLLIKGTNFLKINVRNLVPGIYYTKVQIGQEMWYRKIIVQ